MKKQVILLLLLFLFGTRVVEAKETIEVATEGAEMATESAKVATKTASLEIEKVVEQDITERTSPVKNKLEEYLAGKEVGDLRWNNFLQVGIRQAVAHGVSANTMVLILLFPLITALIAAGRHLLGLTGFGIFVPAMLSVAFLATGIKVGLLLFGMIWILASFSRKVTKRLKLQYLPRMALLMWFISLGLLGVMIFGVNYGFSSLGAVSIFPILILLLLSENFIEVQVGKSKREAFRVTAQTLIMAVIGAILLRIDLVQKVVLLNPESYLALLAMFNIYVGKYVGLRALELVKFKELLK